MSRRRSLLLDQSGVSAVEFALILPVMLTLCLGMFEGTAALRANMKLRVVAQTVAELVAAQATADSTAITNYCAAAKLVMAPYSTTTLSAGIASVSNGGGGAAQDWQNTSCGSAASVANAVTLGAPMVPSSGNSVIVVTATYAYTGAFTYILPRTINMSQVAFARPRSNTTIPYQ